MNKEAILDKVKQRLIDEFGKNILSAVVYGSTLGDDYCKASDFDFLLIFQKVDFNTFKRLREIKREFAEQDIVVDFNSHTLAELPQTRKGAFWHNNRGVYIQKELALYGRVLFGEVYFKDLTLKESDILLETVRVVSSLNYQARKIISNKELNMENRVIMMKWCIYGTMYVLAARGCFPSGRREALQIFNEQFAPEINPEVFLDIKINRPDKITMDDMKKAYDFLVYLDNVAYTMYEEKNGKGISD